MASYQRRIIDDELDALLPALPALAINGPRGVGKTATATERAKTVIRLDRPAVLAIHDADPERVTRAASPVLIDEWQRLPPVWDVVRRAVDDGAAPGSFLLTGSASPTTAPAHTGAGRIVSLRLRPLSLAERGLDPTTVSVAALLRGEHPEIGGETPLRITEYAEEIVASGFPGIRPLPPRARRAQLDGYLDLVVERDFPEQGHLVRRPSLLRGWLRAYAGAVSSTAGYSTIIDAATPGDAEKPAKTTTIAYRDVLSQLWLLDPVEAWTPREGVGVRLVKGPKHQLADPALAAHLLGLDAPALLEGSGTALGRPDTTILGPLFESLVTLSLKVYAQAAEASVAHLRTHDGTHEVDLVVVRGDGRVVAVEVKLHQTVTDADVRHLTWLRDRLGDRLLDAVVITTGGEAYRRRDGVAVVPAALLGP
ncbi:MAG: DUF4143 domain-containing protein [Quadrisphaera sp.]